MLVPALLYLFALGLRVAWIVAVPSKPVGDFAMYIEAATYLRAHGRFDPQFVYMPGYVLLLAGVQALGGKWLGIKLMGAGLSALGAPLCHGITHRLWNRRAAAAAGVLYAIWPGGVAVGSVTGTDIPAAIFVALAVFVLVRATPEQPWRAGAVAGCLFGAAAWMRAVALPLAPLTALFFWARTRDVRRACLATACTTLGAFLVLAPWGIRNFHRYGEFFLTDSHGGLTAMVGAYPNSDGQFTRALNRMFEEATGIEWLSEPHREADALAYAEAKRWTRVSPSYALGLALQRADKLLSNERSLLYWPLYREGVLPDAVRGPFDRWRPEIEAATDVFWWFLLLACIAAAPLAIAQRKTQGLALLPLQLALVGVYTLFFAESRYHLTIAVLAFPGAAAAAVFAFDALRAAVSVARGPVQRPIPWRPLAVMVATVVGLLAAWPLAMTLGQRLRERHRFAVHACMVAGVPRFCVWRRSDEQGGPSPVRGVFDGVGLRTTGAAVGAVLEVPLAEGSHVLRGVVSFFSQPGQAHMQASLTVNGVEVLRRELTQGAAVRLDMPFVARAGSNLFEFRLIPGPASGALHATAWLDSIVFIKMP